MHILLLPSFDAEIACIFNFSTRKRGENSLAKEGGRKRHLPFFRQGRAPMHPSSLLRLFSSPVLVPRPQMIFMSHFFCQPTTTPPLSTTCIRRRRLLADGGGGNCGFSSFFLRLFFFGGEGRGEDPCLRFLSLHAKKKLFFPGA